MKKPIKPLAAIALTAPLAGCGADNQEKPNIIPFLIDDMGWLDTSVSFGEEVYPYNIRQDKTLRNVTTCLTVILKNCRKWPMP